MAGLNNNGASKPFSNGTYSLGTPSRNISTPHFYGAQSKVNFTLPVQGSSKAMLAEKPSFGFSTHPNYLKTPFNATDFTYSPRIDENGYAHVTTSSRKVSFSAEKLFENGYLSPVFHEEDLLTQDWINAASGDRAISYSTPQKGGGLVEGQERRAFFDLRDTQLNKFVRPVLSYEGPINSFGKYLSTNANFRQDIRNVLFDETHKTRYDSDTADFISFLSNKYSTPRHILGVGTEKMEDVARIYHDNNHSYLVSSTDFRKKAEAMAEEHGLTGRDAAEFFKRYSIYHELIHNFQPEMSERGAEIDDGETLYEFFSEKAKSKAGTKEGRLYQSLATEAKAYANFWRSKGSSKRSKGSNNLESKITELETEARSLGLKGEEFNEYVSERLDEIADKESDLKESALEEKVNETDSGYKGRNDNREYNNEDIEETDDNASEAEPSE